MALFRKLFYRKPPDGLLEICERVYVFDSCFMTDTCKDEDYKGYIGGIVSQLKEYLVDSSFLVFNFREGEKQSQINEVLTEYDMTVMEYPRQYEGCPLLTMGVIHHVLRSGESWLSVGMHNVLLMHCERGGWPVLAFMLAALLLFRKQYSGEQKTLEMIYKQAPHELLQLLSPVNPIPSQLRYLQYVSRRNVATEWPPLDRALTLDCIILRLIPNFDGDGGCRPIFRIYGQDPFLGPDQTTKVLYSTPKQSKAVRSYKQAECELAKIDINCHIQGDVVLESVSLHDDLEREEMMFRVVFNTAFIRSNILILNNDEIDTLWGTKNQFPKDFRAEIIFSEMDASSSIVSLDFSGLEDKEGLPAEAFAKVHEIFSSVDWSDPMADAALNMLQHMNTSIIHEQSEKGLQHKLEFSPKKQDRSPSSQKERKVHTVFESDLKSSLSPHSISLPQKIESICLPKPSPDVGVDKKAEPKKDGSQVAPQIPIKSDDIYQQKHQLSLLQKSEKADCTRTTVDPVASDKPLSVSSQTEPVELKSDSMSSSTPSLQAMTSSATKIISPTPPSPRHLMKESDISKEEEGQLSSASTQPAPKVSATPQLPLNTPRPPPCPPTLPPLEDNLTIKAGTPLRPPSPSPTIAPSKKDHTIRTPQLPLAQAPSLKDDHNIRADPPPLRPPPPPPPTPPLKDDNTVRVAPPPPFPSAPPLKDDCTTRAGPPPPPPPPFHAGQTAAPVSSPMPTVPPPPPIPSSNSSRIPSAPPPPAIGKGISNAGGNGDNKSSIPTPPITKGRLSRTISSKSNQTKKLKPLHWLKLTRAVQGSLWAEAQKGGEAAKAPEIDISELESLFSAAAPTTGQHGKPSAGVSQPKVDKVQLIEHRRAYNCEIMLSKVKVPLNELTGSVLALEDSLLDVDQVENLIKFCPTKEEMELLKGYTGDHEKLGRCEQFFLELMKLPRVELKLRVFAFKMQFHSQVSDLRKSLNVVNFAAEEIRNSDKLKRIMQTILSLGNALNQGTARGSAVGFRLDTLLKLTDTRAKNNKMTLMHYLCKVLSDKLPELLDFSKDLGSLEPSSKIQLKFLAEEMQAISKGLEKVVQELSSSENDGSVSEKFCQVLKQFLHIAEAEVRSLASLYSRVGRNVDALIVYFGEDPARVPFEQVVSTLVNFVRLFNKAHEENCKQIEAEMKKHAENDKSKGSAPQKHSEGSQGDKSTKSAPQNRPEGSESNKSKESAPNKHEGSEGDKSKESALQKHPEGSKSDKSKESAPQKHPEGSESDKSKESAPKKRPEGILPAAVKTGTAK